MKRFIKTVGILLLTVVLICGVFPQETFAAKNVCILFQGSAAKYNTWKTVILKTGKNWGSNNITFTQTKGSLELRNHLQTQTKKIYGAYTIKVDDGNGEKTYWWKYKETYTLKLNDNTTYTIKIKPYQPKTVGEQNMKTFFTKALDKAGVSSFNSWSWKSAPTWKTTSTKAVDWCQTMN